MKNRKTETNKSGTNNSKGKKTRKVPFIVRAFVWLLAILAVAAVAAYSLWNYETSPITEAGDSENEVKEFITVPSGMSVTQISEILEEKGLIRSAKLFYYAARFNVFDRNSTFSLRRGDYNVTSSMSMKEIYFLLQVGSQQSVTVRIPEGLTIKKIANLIEEAGVCSSQDFMIACHDKELLVEFNIPAESCEGFLFPDTYYLTKEMEGEQVVRRLLENFVQQTSTIEGFSDIESSEDLFNLITLASVVEREYKVSEEAPIIASVFKNRLKIDMPLQSCATIEYIITEIQGKPHPEKILYSDLEIQNPYNTYINAGLPPGPISNPGIAAIKATVHPAETDYKYFVLTDADAGTHTFSKTFNQHKKAQNTATINK